jgi:hypothetical protein
MRETKNTLEPRKLLPWHYSHIFCLLNINAETTNVCKNGKENRASLLNCSNKMAGYWLLVTSKKHTAPTCHVASVLFELDCPKADTTRNNFTFLRLSWTVHRSGILLFMFETFSWAATLAICARSGTWILGLLILKTHGLFEIRNTINNVIHFHEKDKLLIQYRIWGSHSGCYEHYYFLGYNVV